MGFNDFVQATYTEDYLYGGALYIGESNMQASVIFDTGSDWLLIEGRDCTNCKGNRYDPNTSGYFAETNMRTHNLQYGSFIHVRGKEVYDMVCLTSF